LAWAVPVHSRDIHGTQNISGIARREADTSPPAPRPVTAQTARLFFPSGGGGAAMPGGANNSQPAFGSQSKRTGPCRAVPASGCSHPGPGRPSRTGTRDHITAVGRRIMHHWPSGHRPMQARLDTIQLQPVRDAPARRDGTRPHPPRARHGARALGAAGGCRVPSTFTCRGSCQRSTFLSAMAGEVRSKIQQHYTTYGSQEQMELCERPHQTDVICLLV